MIGRIAGNESTSMNINDDCFELLFNLLTVLVFLVEFEVYFFSM